jgi:hypothetical protein
VGGLGLHLSSSGKEQLVGCCESGHESMVHKTQGDSCVAEKFIKLRGVLVLLKIYELITVDSAPLSYTLLHNVSNSE